MYGSRDTALAGNVLHYQLEQCLQNWRPCCHDRIIKVTFSSPSITIAGNSIVKIGSSVDLETVLSDTDFF